MSESTSIIPAELAGELTKASDDKDFAAVAGSGGFLGRIMLMASGSKLVVSTDMKAGDYALISGDDFTDLGSNVDVLVLAWRPKALDTSGDEIVECHDPSNPIFEKIKVKSGVKDSECMFGAEFLLYSKQAKEFAGYFMSSKTARREAPELRKYLAKAATLNSRLIDPPKSKYAWWGPVVKACSTPFPAPPIDAIKEQAHKFNNPPVDDREESDAPSGDRER